MDTIDPGVAALRHGAARRCAAHVLAAFCVATTPPATCAGVAGASGPAALPQGFVPAHVSQLSWQPPQETQIFGLPMSWRGFSSRLPLPQAAQVLAARTGIFQQAMAFRQRIVLSGMQGNKHWVAEIVAAGQGSAGVVSSLPADSAVLHTALSGRATLLADWVPARARLRLSQASVLQGRKVRQQVYTIEWPLARLRTYVHERLRAQGWVFAGPLARQAAAPVALPHAAARAVPGTWRRNGQRLVLAFEPLAEGSALYVRHHP